MIVSFIQLLFPISVFMERLLLFKTKRKSDLLTVNFFNELCLFLVVVWIIFDTKRFGTFRRNNRLSYPEMDRSILFESNIIWFYIKDEYKFDLLLAILAFNIWLKLLLKLRLTSTFGPMFKILVNMSLDLIKFLVLWSVILLIFGCVGMLIFAQLDTFETLPGILALLFEACLGVWDMKVFIGNDVFG